METKILKLQKCFNENGKTRIADEMYIDLYDLDRIIFGAITDASKEIRWSNEELAAMKWLYQETMHEVWIKTK